MRAAGMHWRCLPCRRRGAGASRPSSPAIPLQPVVTPPPSPSVTPQVLSAADVALYRQIMAAERTGEICQRQDPVGQGQRSVT